MLLSQKKISYKSFENTDEFDKNTFANVGEQISRELSRSRKVSSSGRHQIELSRSVFLQQKSAHGTHSCLSFHNVNYFVTQKRYFHKNETKQILHNVSGIFSPGLNAIMGPTGSGKTTLLDLLAMRKEPEGFSGLVLLEGQPLPKDFKLISCYVVQDDVVMGTLTVRENLMFSAKLRLRGNQRLEIEDRVEQVLLDLNLDKCADTLIGTQLLKGVSGGERKRCNIGVELLTQPTVLFLDEPTTGLDSTTAFNVMKHLKMLASQGRTVIFSIHQPRYSIYKLFDTLHLISKGDTVYHGPASRALEFFSACGYPCDSFNNPPDFFLDVMMDCEGTHESPNVLLQSGRSRRSHSQTQECGLLQRTDLVAAFEESSFNKQLQEKLKVERDYSKGEAVAFDLNHFKVDYPANIFQQMFYISQRLFRNTRRCPGPVISQIIVATVFSLIGGSFFYDTGNNHSIQSGFQNRQGVTFFTCANGLFGSIAVITIFVIERPLFLHETANGFYRISTYFISKVLMEVIPLRTIPTVIFVTIIYWLAGFKSDPDVFLLCLFSVLMVAFAGVSVGLAVSATFNVIQVAILSATTTFVLMLLFAGFYVRIDNIPVPFSYIEYLSILKYGLQAVEIKEMEGMTFYDGNTTKTGEMFLAENGIVYETSWDYWKNHVALGSLTVISLFITYIRLRMIKKLK